MFVSVFAPNLKGAPGRGRTHAHTHALIGSELSPLTSTYENLYMYKERARERRRERDIRSHVGESGGGAACCKTSPLSEFIAALPYLPMPVTSKLMYYET